MEHRHKWFEESSSELASLLVLYRLAYMWAVNPPAGIAASLSFAPVHADHARVVEHSTLRFRARSCRNGWMRTSEQWKRAPRNVTLDALLRRHCCASFVGTRHFGKIVRGSIVGI